MLAAHPAEVTSILQPGCGSGGYHHDLQLGWDKVFLRKERNYKTDTSHPQTRLLFPPSPTSYPQNRLLFPPPPTPDQTAATPLPPQTRPLLAAPPPPATFSHLRPGCCSPSYLPSPTSHPQTRLRLPGESCKILHLSFDG